MCTLKSLFRPFANKNDIVGVQKTNLDQFCVRSFLFPCSVSSSVNNFYELDDAFPIAYVRVEWQFVRWLHSMRVV